MITKKKNLPVINVFATAEPKTKRLLGEMYMQAGAGTFGVGRRSSAL